MAIDTCNNSIHDLSYVNNVLYSQYFNETFDKTYSCNFKKKHFIKQYFMNKQDFQDTISQLTIVFSLVKTSSNDNGKGAGYSIISGDFFFLLQQKKFQ